ncbi:MAG: hypothetical protein ACLUHC_02360 [Clostridia bacterium]
MKIFHKEENGKEVVFVQEEDILLFIIENREMPLCILEVFYKDGIKPVDAVLRRFVKIDSEEAVKFFKEKDYIIDYNQYKDFTVRQLERKIKRVGKEIIKIEQKIEKSTDDDIRQIAQKVEAYCDKEYLRYELFLLKDLKEGKTKINFPNLA